MGAAIEPLGRLTTARVSMSALTEGQPMKSLLCGQGPVPVPGSRPPVLPGERN
jgi:hypothetical protein